MMTLGSLFSGSGGFELAGALNGITPVWASEIEPYPIAVTTSRFPHLEHLGNVSHIDGGKITPVDVITFGSPCFPAGTLVLTDQGYRPIENLRVGDIVLTHRGNWKPVAAIGHKEWNTVVLKGKHYGLETTPEHPIWSAETKHYYPQLGGGKRGNCRVLDRVGEWTQAKDMLGKRWATPNKVAPLPLPVLDDKGAPGFDENLMYFIGMWLGDGWLESSGYGVILCAAGTKIANALHTMQQVFGKNAVVRKSEMRTVTRLTVACKAVSQ